MHVSRSIFRSDVGRRFALAVLVAAAGAATARADAAADRAAVGALDTQYQAAVAANDASTMDRILANDFVLVTGKGKTYDKHDLLESARKKEVTYERQEEILNTQTVRVWGDTAVVTARLWIKGMQGKDAIDYQLWFSDTYARTPTGWRYVFGQAAQRLTEGQ
jgi:ketosteroid isomerase-like protein